MTYNTQQLILQPRQVPQGFLRKVLTGGQPFGFSKTNEAISLTLTREVKPSDMAAFEANKEKPLYWDEAALICETFSGWTQWYLLIVGLIKLGVLCFMLPFYFIMALLATLFGNWSWETFISAISDPVILGGGGGALLIYIHFKLVDAGFIWLAPFMKAHKLFELNRQSGMVTLFDGHNRPRFSHPFIEFDCVLMSGPTPQGHLNYNLMLVHRYQNYHVGVPLGQLIGPNERLLEYHRLWNMVQRYMDISQPLPDIMILEPARAKDPATVAYDKAHHRDPRYWRDMSDEVFEQTLEEIAKLQKTQPVGGPEINIFVEEDNTECATV